MFFRFLSLLSFVFILISCSKVQDYSEVDQSTPMGGSSKREKVSYKITPNPTGGGGEETGGTGGNGNTDTTGPLVSADLQPLTSTARSRSITGQCEYSAQNTASNRLKFSGSGISEPIERECPASGQFSVLIELSVGDGEKEIFVSQKDAAGNETRKRVSANLLCNTPPIVLSNAAEFISNLSSRPYSCYKLGASFALGSLNQIPVFYGVLDGADHTISSVSHTNGQRYASLIQVNEGTIKNLRIDGLNVSGEGDVAGLVNVNRGTISRVFVSNAMVEATMTQSFGYHAAGFVFMNLGTIEKSSYSGSLKAAGLVGGLAFMNHGVIRDVAVNLTILGTSAGAGVSMWAFANSKIDRAYVVLTKGGYRDDGIGARSVVFSALEVAYVSNAYFDRETSAFSTTVGQGGGIGKSSAEMKSVVGFTGFDFNSVWMSFPGGYHQLR